MERALEHVAGYTCFVDGSVRDYQKFSVTSGKNFPGTGPLGPWMVTTDEIPDPDQAHPDDPAQRPGGATLRHRPPDLFDPAHRGVLLGLHHARARRRDRDRHARRRRPPPQSAALDEERATCWRWRSPASGHCARGSWTRKCVTTRSPHQGPRRGILRRAARAGNARRCAFNAAHDPAEALAKCADAEILIIRTDEIFAELVDAMPKLQPHPGADHRHRSHPGAAEPSASM